MKIHALHGFLGLPSDWNDFTGFHAVNPFGPLLPKPDQGLASWGCAFNQQVEAGSIILGYSLGGRLALHALLDKPSHWKGGIIISAHPGLKSDAERDVRLQNDAAWAKRFEEDPWEALMLSWNAQEVFGGKPPPFQRSEQDLNRKQLSDVLLGWSLAKQDDLSDSISKLPLPILWIAGAQDTRYKLLAESQKLSHPQSKKWIAPEAGHRIPWERKKSFETEINQFLHTI